MNEKYQMQYPLFLLNKWLIEKQKIKKKKAKMFGFLKHVCHQ